MRLKFVQTCEAIDFELKRAKNQTHQKYFIQIWIILKQIHLFDRAKKKTQIFTSSNKSISELMSILKMGKINIKTKNENK